MAFKMEPNTTQISNIFIDEYMPKAFAPFVLAYLFAYRHCSGGNTGLSDKEVAKALDLLESDVVKAWKYWQEQGLLKLHDDGSVEFLPVESRKEKRVAEQTVFLSRPPSYSPEEISVYLEKSKVVKGLFLSAQAHLGKLLSQNDMSMIFSFYDWLRLTPEVIEILLAYCVQGGHRNMNYIEKVAISWAEEGIDTPQKALDYMKLRKNGYREIMGAFGQRGRTPSPAEEGFMKRWLTEYEMPLDVIKMACERTILQTGTISYPYAESILVAWQKEKVKSREDVERLDATFAAAKQAKKAQKEGNVQKAVQAPKAVKQNRFVNYEQRNWDFQELERLEREKRKNGE